MATGFVLITTKPGKEHDVRARLDEIEEVTNRWMLFGEYDLIAKVESEEEYVEKAIQFSSNLSQLSSLRAQLRDQVLASPVFDSDRFSKN